MTEYINDFFRFCLSYIARPNEFFTSLDPRIFISEELSGKLKPMPYLWILILTNLFFLAIGFFFILPETKEKLASIPYPYIIVCLVFFYIFSFFFFKLRLYLSGVKKPGNREVLLICIYNVTILGIIFDLYNTLLEINNILIKFFPSLPDISFFKKNSLVLVIASLVSFLVNAYFCYINYVGVIKLTKAKHEKALWWFFILPVLFFFLCYTLG